MKLSHFLVGIGLVLPAMGGVVAAGAVDDVELGLTKGSVFDVPSPEPFEYNAAVPGNNETLPTAYPGLPPQIPHSIAAFIPVTLKSNQCVACHNRPELIGKPVVKGLPTPMPKSHYTDLMRTPDKVSQEINGSHYGCTQCHVPVADVKPLTGNTFEGDSSEGDSSRNR